MDNNDTNKANPGLNSSYSSNILSVTHQINGGDRGQSGGSSAIQRNRRDVGDNEGQEEGEDTDGEGDDDGKGVLQEVVRLCLYTLHKKVKDISQYLDLKLIKAISRTSTKHVENFKISLTFFV